MFETLEHKKLKLLDCEIDFVIGGKGLPLLLLHGFPETKIAWHKITAQLSKDFTLIIPDLPGYGDSMGPEPDPENKNYSKRNIGTVLTAFMDQLGFASYSIAGHDRGARVAYRMALDHPSKISRLAILNVLPTLEVLEGFDYDKAMALENWLFLSQPFPLPETLLALNAAFYLNYILDSWSMKSEAFPAGLRLEYLRCFEKQSVLTSICAEFRATRTDAEIDQKDRDHGRRIQCPVLILWSEKDFPDKTNSPLNIWKKWAVNVTGKGLASGHFLMEECSQNVLDELQSFFKSPQSSQ